MVVGSVLRCPLKQTLEGKNGCVQRDSAQKMLIMCCLGLEQWSDQGLEYARQPG